MLPIKKIALLITIAFGLTACGPREPESTFVSRVTGEFVITEINRPKHFRVSLRDVDTGARYERIYVSKHCNKWRQLKIGSVWRFPKETRELPDGRRFVKVLDVRKLCDRL